MTEHAARCSSLMQEPISPAPLPEIAAAAAALGPAALASLRQSPHALQAAVARLAKKGRLVSPRRSFYLILRPEDRTLGTPDPARWIAPLMGHTDVLPIS